MANKIKFDRDVVLEKACILFWKKGYHSTSTRDLQEAIDLRPGSIYAAFGSKQGLYVETLNFYAETMSAKLEHCIAENKDVLSGLECFARLSAADNDEQNFDACMLSKANSELTDEDRELRSLCTDLIARFEAKIESLFADAIINGELNKEVLPSTYAQHFMVIFIGLRQYLSCPYNTTIADSLISQSFSLLRKL